MKRAKQQFAEEVFPAEIEEIKKIRQRRGDNRTELQGPPSTDMGLVGLSLSGGGIRSAAFSLGVIQALEKHGILKAIDYLSTVSGGGFIGSCLSSMLNTDVGRDEDESPFRHRLGAEEPPALRHIRDNSNYLIPGGILNKMRIPALFLRGMIINFSIYIAFVMLVAVEITELTYEFIYSLTAFYKNIFFVGSWTLFLIMVILFPFVSKLFFRQFTWHRRNLYELLTTLSFLVPLILIALAPLLLAVDLAIGYSWQEVKEWLLDKTSFGADDYWKWLIAVAVVVIFLLGSRASQKVSRWTGKLVLYLLGLLGPAILFVTYLLLCVLQIDSPFIDKKFHNLETESSRLTFNEEIARNLDQGRISDDLWKALETRDVPRDSSVRIKVEGKLWQIIDSDTGSKYCTIRKHRERLKIYELDLWDGNQELYYFGILAFFLLLLLFVDVNITSATGFYRDRLSRAFLFQLNEEGKVEHRDGLRLSSLNTNGTAPYHLLDAALNLEGGKNRNLFGRNADFFMFSKRYIGSDRTGFSKTQDMEYYDRHLNLGTAMAISGAAAAPNRGMTTVRPLVLIMTLLNIRLNYWLPNPSVVNNPSWWQRILLRLPVGLLYLFKEAVGRLNARGTYVNVSDGGHIENLGIYHLLRRRCKSIIAVDAGTDLSYEFGSLAKLIRFARIDMGIDIDIDLKDLRKCKSGLCGTHWAVGKIRYSESEIGYLYCIKPSITGDENEYIREYRSRNPEFPHQSLTYQFFDETQFEVYRALGFHAANRLFAEMGETSQLRWLKSPEAGALGQ